MSDVKSRTFDAIYNFYKSNNCDSQKTINVARKMLTSKNSSPLIRGELCEAVLTILLQRFIEDNNLKKKGWFISKGMYLKDLDNPDSSYITELDITLFTPRQIYMFECKSYKGAKTLKDECSIYVKRNGKTSLAKDVYDQQFKHFTALLKYVKPFLNNVKSPVAPFKIIYFDFSDGDIKDVREDKYKVRMPLVDENTLYSLFDNYNSIPDYWDIKGIYKVVQIVNKNKNKLDKKHLSYVKSLHGSK